MTFLLSCNDSPNVIHVEKTIYIDHLRHKNPIIDSLKALSNEEYKNGHIDDAINLCERIILMDSNDVDNLARLAQLYLITNNNIPALKLVNRSITLDTLHDFVYNITTKASVFKELNIPDSANFYLKKMKSDSKNQALILYSFALAYSEYKNYIKANEYIDLSLEFDPSNYDSKLAKAELIGMKSHKDAIKYLCRIEKPDAPAQLFFYRSVLYRNCDKNDSALIDVERALKLGYMDYWVYTARGRAKHKLKDFKGAAADYKIAIEQGDTTAMRFQRLLDKDIAKK
jgi:tetratricopeptide (TPR) repeat protein